MTTPVPKKPEWSKICVFVLVEGVLSSEKRVVNSHAVGCMRAAIKLLMKPGRKVEVVCLSRGGGYGARLLGILPPGIDTYESQGSIEIIEDVLMQKIGERLDSGFVIVCNESEDDVPYGARSNMVRVPRDALLDKNTARMVAKTAEAGPRALRMFELDRAGYSDREMLNSSLNMSLQNVNVAITLLSAAGKHMDIKTDFEFYTDDMNNEAARANFNKNMEEAEEMFAKIKDLYVTVYNQERERIGRAYEADFDQALNKI